MEKKVSKINIFFNTLSIKFMSFEIIFNVLISFELIAKLSISLLFNQIFNDFNLIKMVEFLFYTWPQNFKKSLLKKHQNK